MEDDMKRNIRMRLDAIISEVNESDRHVYNIFGYAREIKDIMEKDI